MAGRKFSSDELVQLIAELPMETDVRSAYAQLLTERKLFEQAVPYLRELCDSSGARRAEDTTLDWICSELGSDAWRDEPGWLEDFGPPSK
jgi:hypothetical protein